MYNRARSMFRHVPNVLTISRLLLAAVFFAMLSYYQYQGRGDPWFLNIAFVIYLVALGTDFLDGYLARRWKVEGPFGRVLDPFVDKILVLGSFIFFSGKNFIIPVTEMHATDVVKTITGVPPVVVVLLLSRELLVTMLRGIAESGGASFGAVWAGKVKMVVQSFTILVILAYVNYLHTLEKSPDVLRIATLVRDVFIWFTVVVTLYSGVGYVRKALALYRSGVGAA
jgi:CDP-diacylglycerol---glycerol-3-phosphate 3-phosphatidyltransferase